MIISTVANILLEVLNILLLPVQLPSLPENVQQTMQSVVDYVGSGMQILANFLDFAYLGPLFAIAFLIHYAHDLYRVVMWLLRKIPFLSLGKGE